MFDVRTIRVSWIAAPTLALLVALPAGAAMDITAVEFFWVQDRLDGTPIPNPYTFEVVVQGTEIDSVNVETPATGVGTIPLTDVGGGEWENTGTASYATAAALLGDHLAGAWRITFVEEGTLATDFLDIVLTPSQPTGFIDVSTPVHDAPTPTPLTVSWADCSVGCTGTHISGDAVDVDTDSDVAAFVTTNLAVSSWSPANISAGVRYEFEMILANYQFLDASLATNAGDAFALTAGFEDINIIQTTPEPSTAVLTGFGLLGVIALRRRLAVRG